MISTGTPNKPATEGKSGYGPKTGLFKATVAAINPSQEEVNKLLGKQVNWNTEYTGTTQEGDRRAVIEIWLREITQGDYYRLKFQVVDKLRESANNPGNFQWVNTAGNLVYATDPADLAAKTGTIFDMFRERKYRNAMVGEENLFEFFNTWITQGKKPWDSMIIDPVMSNLFKGDFSELSGMVQEMSQRTDKGAVMALATISEKGDKKYQNVWKRIAPSWFYEKIQGGDRTGNIGRWLDEIQGAYGVRDTYDLNNYLSGNTAEPVAAPAGYNSYGANPGTTVNNIPGAHAYQQYSNKAADGVNDLPF